MQQLDLPRRKGEPTLAESMGTPVAGLWTEQALVGAARRPANPERQDPVARAAHTHGLSHVTRQSTPIARRSLGLVHRDS
jgi:hypothetical protein